MGLLLCFCFVFLLGNKEMEMRKTKNGILYHVVVNTPKFFLT